MNKKLTKKEKVLYSNYGKKWDVIVKHKIGLFHNDYENIIRCHELLADHGAVCLKRLTKKIRFFDKYLYINELYGGIEWK